MATKEPTLDEVIRARGADPVVPAGQPETDGEPQDDTGTDPDGRDTPQDGGTDDGATGEDQDDGTDDSADDPINTGDGNTGDDDQDSETVTGDVDTGAGGVGYGDGAAATDQQNEYQDVNQQDIDIDPGYTSGDAATDAPPPPTGGPSLADIERLKSSFVRDEGPPEIDPDGGSFGNAGTAGWDPKTDGDGPAALGDIYSGLRAEQPGGLGDDPGFGTGADLPAGAPSEPQGFGGGDDLATRDLGRFDGEPIDGPAFELEPVAVEGKGFDEVGDAPLLARPDPKSSEDTGPDRDAAFDFG